MWTENSEEFAPVLRRRTWCGHWANGRSIVAVPLWWRHIDRANKRSERWDAYYCVWAWIGNSPQSPIVTISYWMNFIVRPLNGMNLPSSSTLNHTESIPLFHPFILPFHYMKEGERMNRDYQKHDFMIHPINDVAGQMMFLFFIIFFLLPFCS